jgi:hypothetical protein
MPVRVIVAAEVGKRVGVHVGWRNFVVMLERENQSVAMAFFTRS